MSTQVTAFGWRELDEQIREFLHGEGLPAGEADRLSGAVIRMCAEAAESLDRDQLHAAAWEEAGAVLETWRAARREPLTERA